MAADAPGRTGPRRRPLGLRFRRPMASAARILLVDDEASIQKLLSYPLQKDGYEVVRAADGREALARFAEQAFDLVILDVMLPHVDGLEVCKQLRARSAVPIIMLSARSEEIDKVLGLELGADDYITKPFSPRVLMARVRAVLRRKAKAKFDEQSTIQIHELSIHPGRHEAFLAGKPLELTFTEFRLLHFLAQRPGWAFTRLQIVDSVKGEDYPVTERSVDVQVASLRKKLGECGGYIETVRGVGYRFKE